MSEDSVCANLEHTADEHGYPFFREWEQAQREPVPTFAIDRLPERTGNNLQKLKERKHCE